MARSPRWPWSVWTTAVRTLQAPEMKAWHVISAHEEGQNGRWQGILRKLMGVAQRSCPFRLCGRLVCGCVVRRPQESASSPTRPPPAPSIVASLSPNPMTSRVYPCGLGSQHERRNPSRSPHAPCRLSSISRPLFGSRVDGACCEAPSPVQTLSPSAPIQAAVCSSDRSVASDLQQRHPAGHPPPPMSTPGCTLLRSRIVHCIACPYKAAFLAPRAASIISRQHRLLPRCCHWPSPVVTSRSGRSCTARRIAFSSEHGLQTFFQSTQPSYMYACWRQHITELTLKGKHMFVSSRAMVRDRIHEDCAPWPRVLVCMCSNQYKPNRLVMSLSERQGSHRS